jgi:hypothetical protein
MRYVEDCKKALLLELQAILDDVVPIESIDSATSEEENEDAVIPKPKKKKNSGITSLLGYLDDPIEPTDSDEGASDEKKNEEKAWFKKSYLEVNVCCKTIESSELFWKERKTAFPNVIVALSLSKYRLHLNI